jgi:threonine aldolase
MNRADTPSSAAWPPGRPDDPHAVRTRLVCLENTHNRAGGKVLPYDQVEAVCRWAQQNGLRRHLDGARLFHAVVATGIQAADWTQHFDTVGVCFSKGLGAPVGSALAGPRELIREAIRHRKVVGGGMRQAGVIAAGALYALENHIDRLAEDHARAKRLAVAITQIEGLQLLGDSVDTNIIYFRVDPDFLTAAELVARLKDLGLLMISTSADTIRAVTHLDVSDDDVDRAIAILGDAVARGAA